MVELIQCWRTIIDQLSVKRPDLNRASHKFKLLLVAEAEKYNLSPRQVNEMMLTFGHVVSRRPKNVPETWKLSWCKSFLGQKYDNPENAYEYVAVVPNMRRGFLPYIIHNSSNK